MDGNEQINQFKELILKLILLKILRNSNQIFFKIKVVFMIIF